MPNILSSKGDDFFGSLKEKKGTKVSLSHLGVKHCSIFPLEKGEVVVLF